MSLTVELDRDERCFGLPEWPSLLDADPQRHIFATPQWQRAWWDEFRTGKDLLVLKMQRGAEIVALVPLYRKQEGSQQVLRFVGGIDLTDYLGPICSPEDGLEVAGALVGWLASTDVEWDVFDAHNMPVPFGFAEFLVERADNAGFRFSLEQEETAARLLLPRSWDEYLGFLEPKERHELRRKRRRLVREHPDAVFRTSDEATEEADFKLFVDMHRGADGLKGHFMRPEIATFFERLVNAFMPLGALRLDFLEVNGRPVATTFGFEWDRALYLYNSAYEPEARRLSPGLILVSELVKRAIEDGLEVFDFLRGPERYKYQLGGQALPLHNVQIFNRGDAPRKSSKP